MIYELRTYTLIPGKQGEYLKLNAEVGRPTRGQKYGTLEGSWTTPSGLARISSPPRPPLMKCFRSSPDRTRRNPHFPQGRRARLTVIGATGIARPVLRMAARTRSRLSCTGESGKPTVLKVGAAPPLRLSP
jgi:hypothetical protein